MNRSRSTPSGCPSAAHARRVGACPERGRGIPAAKPHKCWFVRGVCGLPAAAARCIGAKAGDPPRKTPTCHPGIRLGVLAAAVALAVLADGCQKQAATPEVRRPSLEKDPCAERLHDLSGRLLLYYAAHHRLPETLAALPPLDPAHPTPTVCPASGKPYVYRPKGLAISGRPGRLVLYDPEPSHAGMRWGVFIDKAPGANRLTARVILLPEDWIPTAEDAAAPEPAPAPSP